MKNLKIYYISESYINYLRQFDKNVAYNKNTTRPYIGIVYTYNNFNYFAPLASPKAKHKNINPKAIDIYKIKVKHQLPLYYIEYHHLKLTSFYDYYQMEGNQFF